MKNQEGNINIWRNRLIEGAVMLPSYLIIALSLAIFNPPSLVWILLLILGVWIMSQIYNQTVVLKAGLLKDYKQVTIASLIFSGQIAALMLVYCFSL